MFSGSPPVCVSQVWISQSPLQLQKSASGAFPGKAFQMFLDAIWTLTFSMILHSDTPSPGGKSLPTPSSRRGPPLAVGLEKRGWPLLHLRFLLCNVRDLT